MNSLIAKIEADARARLPLPAGRRPAEELSRYKGFLKLEAGRLRMLHRSDGEGLRGCQARAGVMDVLIRHVWEAVQAAYPPAGRPPALALVAFGGYGRGELNPFSDIDLMFLHALPAQAPAEDHRLLADWTSGLLYTLWDLGLKVGHAVRTVEECVDVANRDMLSKTSLLECRPITGDSSLVEALREELEAQCVRGHEAEYIAQRLEDQRTRRAKHGNSPALQEPNIKNGVGGLRDFQNLLWMAYFKHRTRSLAELQAADFLSSAERRQLEAAYDYLLRVRTELHLVADRAVDVLAANLKPKVATGLGYADRSPRLRVERFMRDYYTHARNIYIITRTLEQRMALVAPAGERETPGNRGPAAQFDGFRAADGQLLPVYRTALRDDPRRFLRAFRHCQQRGLSLHPDLAQLMRQQVQLIDREFLADRHNHITFLEILNQRGDVGRHLRAMHEVGLLGKFVPEFGRLTNLVQHEFYHQYAVDEHTLTCLEKLDRVWNATDRPYSNYATILREIEKPFVLYLALLLHDSGKADKTGHHEIVGGELALKAARRLKLDGATTHTLRLIIELHLAMVQVSQRRDLEDREVISEFAGRIQTREQLDLLTLHTFADSMGTSDTLWNGFKDTLLRTLYHKTADFLAGNTEFIRVEVRQRELLQDEVRDLLPRTFAPDEIAAHFEGLPPRYFRVHPPREIARDLILAHQFMHLQLMEADRALEPVVNWQDDRDRGYSTVHICTWDRAGLFSKIAGALTAAGLNIHSAEIYTRRDGIVLDTFAVTDAATGALPPASTRDRFSHILTQCLVGVLDLARAIAKAPHYRPLWQAAPDDRIVTKVRVDNESSPGRTVVDIETEDRVGLLYALSLALYDLGLDIALARIVTEKGAALDTFYVTDADGGQVTDPGRIQVITTRLKQAAEG